jgi:hypothetical protein
LREERAGTKNQSHGKHSVTPGGKFHGMASLKITFLYCAPSGWEEEYPTDTIRQKGYFAQGLALENRNVYVPLETVIW